LTRCAVHVARLALAAASIIAANAVSTMSALTVIAGSAGLTVRLAVWVAAGIHLRCIHRPTTEHQKKEEAPHMRRAYRRSNVFFAHPNDAETEKRLARADKALVALRA
jgi:hypothetical protein